MNFKQFQTLFTKHSKEVLKHNNLFILNIDPELL